MSGNDFQFITNWRVVGTLEEVADILENGPDLVRWWPSVYLNVQEIEPGGPDGVGKVVSLHTKGWLPYTLCWQFRITQNRHPYGFSLEAWGDFVGHGIWTFTQNNEYVDISYDWAIEVEKPLLRRLSFLFKPLFAANHRWAMDQGEKSLTLELSRRRAKTDAELAAVPLPLGPTFKFLISQTRDKELKNQGEMEVKP